ncbi:S8 family serine peptidase [Synechococcus sp. CS-205]|uniref:S8 family serine peptidase n=1 Tax=Synechococcus sp. CS-205 TaxID=2847984 RepID=UPI00223B716F|nr:S8 family serine peptidase [Synechococcus sp. CS-205]MCT0248981.1 S8 family serine peptidase [Synechococcus sp. CS-205]
MANFLDPSAEPTAVTSSGEMAELAAQGLSASSLPAPQVDSIENGEWMTYGVKAVWNGSPPTTNVGEGGVAFVIDTGITTSTEDLNVNTTWSRSWISGVSATTDDNGHGTHVAGTIAGIVGNGLGVVGVAPGATVVPLKALNARGSGSYSSIISAVNHATGIILDNNPSNISNSVINMSLGGPGNDALDEAISIAANQGVRFAISAGNSSQDVDNTSPARAGDLDNVYTISAVDANYQLASFSNYDNVAPGATDKVDFAEPGVRVISWYRNSRTGTFSLYYLNGTSMAAPHAAGALLMGGLSGSDDVSTPTGIQSDPFGLVSSASSPPVSPPPLPTLSFLTTELSQNEGSTTTSTSFQYAVRRSGDLSSVSTINWELIAGSATASDFEGPTNGTLSFDAGQAEAMITLEVAADSEVEADETFSLSLENPIGANLETPSTASGTIQNDDINDETPDSPPTTNDPAQLYFTLATATTLNDLDVQTNDIIAFDGSGFFQALKGDDVGLGGLDIDGFQFLNGFDELLISLRSPASFQGTNYDDSDILRLSKGDDGQYSAEMYFDGSDVRLTRSGEAIDAFALDPVTGNLLISTRGSFSVRGASGSGEDIIAFRPTRLGQRTSGSWGTYLDGSDVGLSGGSENINGLAIDGQTLYITTAGNFSAGGINGANEDVFTFKPTQLGSFTQGSFEGVFFDGSEWGLDTNSLAGFELPSI